MKLKPFIVKRDNAYIFNIQKPYGCRGRMRCILKEGLNLNMVACATVSYILGSVFTLLIFR